MNPEVDQFVREAEKKKREKQMNRLIYIMAGLAAPVLYFFIVAVVDAGPGEATGKPPVLCLSPLRHPAVTIFVVLAYAFFCCFKRYMDLGFEGRIK